MAKMVIRIFKTPQFVSNDHCQEGQPPSKDPVECGDSSPLIGRLLQCKFACVVVSLTWGDGIMAYKKVGTYTISQEGQATKH